MRLHRPNLFALTLLLAGLLGGHQASAQARYAATAPGGYLAVGGAYSYYQLQYGDRALGGPSAYVDLNFTRHIGIEAEGRWLRQGQQADTHETTYLAGPRYQHSVYRPAIQPYVKVLAGEGVFNFPYNYAVGHYFVIAPGAGIELKLNDSFNLRVIDFEYQRWPQFTYGVITPYGVSAGITWKIFSGTRRGYYMRHR